jgi:cupin fold WbuC family metalloprotein
MIDFENQNKESSEVYLSKEKTFSLSSKEIVELKQLACYNHRQRVRFCSHSSSQEPVHEMFIVHPKGAYVRPHKHISKAESMLVIDGEVDYVIFNEEGGIKKVVPMGDYQSGKCFYQSTRTELYHSLLIQSDWLVFVEVTKGPFERKDTVFAQWSPEESDNESIQEFTSHLMSYIK